MLIRDFLCFSGGSEEVMQLIRMKRLPIPDIYTECEWIVRFAMMERNRSGKPFCTVPFDHTLEAQAMGGRVRYGDGTAGPRACDYICQSLEEVEKLPGIDIENGRMRETLEAGRILRESGYEVLFQISGPFTIWNTLIDIKSIFKGIRKEPNRMEKLFGRMEEELLGLIGAVRRSGVRFFSYADSAGGMRILGPHMMEWATEYFTYGFLKKSEELLGKDGIMMLCPQTAYALKDMGYAQTEEITLPETMSYGNACLFLSGRAKFVGQICINRQNQILEDRKIQTIALK